MDRIARVEAEVARLGPIATAGYFLAVRLRGASPFLTFSTFPQAWTDEYMENGYMMRDPITTWALTVGGAVRWSSPFLLDPFGIFRQAAKHGLTHGASVATGPVSSLTLASMARGDRDLTDAEIAEVRAVVGSVHELTEPPKELAAADRDLLAAVGAGRAGDTGRLAELCDLFCVRNPDEAARRARELKLI